MALFEKLDVNPDKVPNTKLGLHIFQGVLAIVIFILEIVLFRADSSIINGNNGWPFGLVRRRSPFTTSFTEKKNLNIQLLTRSMVTVFFIYPGLDIFSFGATV